MKEKSTGSNQNKPPRPSQNDEHSSLQVMQDSRVKRKILNDKLPNQTSPQPFISLSHIVIISGINLTGCALFLTVAAIMVWDEIVSGNTNKVLFVTLPIHLISLPFPFHPSTYSVSYSHSLIPATTRPTVRGSRNCRRRFD